MKTYKIIARPDIRYAHAGYTSHLTEDVLMQALEGVEVRELMDDPHSGHRLLDVRLERSTGAQALDEIASVLQQFGFSIVAARVSEWASVAVERAILGALGAGGVVGVASENPAAALIAAFAGAIVGNVLSSELYKLKAEYDARQDHQGQWSFRQIPQPVQVPQPGFLPA